MEPQYYHIDLHVHTPESRDYKGDKIGDEYLRILRSAKENKIDAICITDHLSIRGFKKLRDKEEQISILLTQLRGRSDADQKFIEKIEEELSLFTSIHILMGIEIKISPGIHYVLVFKENVKLEQAEAFLIRITENNKKVWGTADYIVNMTSLDFFKLAEEQFGDNCFIFAPHSDSDCGVISALKELGLERLQILKDKRLLCLCFNKEATREYVKSNLMPQISKERGIPLNFIQNSDFHGGTGEKVGNLHFCIEKKDGKLRFDLILKRLLREVEIITTLDTSKKRYEEYKKDRLIFKLEIPQDKIAEMPRVLYETICAIVNSNKGYLEFEINIEDDVDAKEATEQSIDYLRENILTKIQPMPDSLFYSMFHLSKSKYAVILNFEISDRLTLFENICYMIDKEGKTKRAEANEIESMVAKKIQKKFGESKDNLIENIAKNSSRVKNSLKGFSIIYGLDKEITPFEGFKMDFPNFHPLPKDLDEIIKKQINGVCKGNLVVIAHESSGIINGRYKNSHLRFSAPCFDVSGVELGDKATHFDKKAIIITPKGGAYLLNQNVDLFLAIPVVKLTLEDGTATNLTLERLIGYFKSSFLEWLICKVYNFDNLFDFLTQSNKIPCIPTLIDSANYEIESQVGNALIEEEKFLKKFEKCSDGADKSEFEKEIIRHNQICDKYVRNIDKHIFQILRMERESVVDIYTELNELGIYDYGGSENIDEIYKK